MTRSVAGTTRRVALGLFLATFVASGCVSVKPLDEAHLSLGDHLVAVGDQRVYVEQQGRGEPVVLVHGFGASSFSWREVLPELARGYRVVALDLSGFGWTDRPDALDSYTRESQVELILGVMDALGIGDAHIIGHSYGGALTMALAGEHPERVRSMVLVDSAAIDYPMKRRMWFAAVPPFAWIYVRGLALRTGSVRRLFERAYYDDALVTNELVEAYLERLRVEGAARAFRGLTRPRPASQWPREIRYEELDVPTLVVWGAEDHVVSLEQGRVHAELLPDHRFVTIEAAGHSPMEETPVQFLKAVTAFLEDVDGDDDLRVACESPPGLNIARLRFHSEF